MPELVTFVRVKLYVVTPDLPNAATSMLTIPAGKVAGFTLRAYWPVLVVCSLSTLSGTFWPGRSDRTMAAEGHS
jgi:hypothetical protein